MKRFKPQRFKSGVIAFIMLTLKLLFTVRTGLDTYAASGDILNVLLIDIAFLAFWLVLAYGDDSDLMRRVKWISAGFAILLYLVFFWIGISVHHETFTDSAVSIFARLSGGALLAYDLWDFVSDLLIMRKASKQASDPMNSLLAFNARLNRKASKQAMRSKPAMVARRDKANELALQLAGADWVRPSFSSFASKPASKASNSTKASKPIAKASYVSYIELPDGSFKCELCGFVGDSKQAMGAHSSKHLREMQEQAGKASQLIEVEP